MASFLRYISRLFYAKRVAVAIKKGSVVVGHVPRKISAICLLFLRVGTITATVTVSHRQYSNDLPQGGVEVPCVFKFCGEVKTIDKVRRLLPANNEQDSDKPPPLKKVKLLSEAILKLSRVRNYFWWIKYWRMTLKIANRQSLLLANILSCTVYIVVCMALQECMAVYSYRYVHVIYVTWADISGKS